MLLTEWNMDEALEVRKEEGREEGRTEGVKIGEARGRAEAAAHYEARIAELERQLAGRR
jgi:flagellar biosynthesis/type III secretory pathway protein FliH